MIIDLEQSEIVAPHHAGVCIAGAGAAGICVALELAKSGLNVTLLESGVFQEEAPTQHLYDSEVSGLPHTGIHATLIKIKPRSHRHFQAGVGSLSPAYRILQFDDSAVARNLTALVQRENYALVTHSIFKPFGLLREAIAAQPAVARKFASEMNLALADPKILGSLLLHYALRSNSGGVVLFSSSDPERVSSNVRGAESCPFTESQMLGFVKFVDAVTSVAGNP
jgi:FAD dependent oxidoreductase